MDFVLLATLWRVKSASALDVSTRVLVAQVACGDAEIADDGGVGSDVAFAGDGGGTRADIGARGDVW